MKTFIKIQSIVLICICTTASHAARDLPVRLKPPDIFGYITLRNVGSCNIVGVTITALPPEPSDIGSLISYFSAWVGTSGFKGRISSIDVGRSTKISQTELVKSDGERLSNRYAIGAYRVDGKCNGESLTATLSGTEDD